MTKTVVFAGMLFALAVFVLHFVVGAPWQVALGDALGDVVQALLGVAVGAVAAHLFALIVGEAKDGDLGTTGRAAAASILGQAAIFATCVYVIGMELLG